MGTAQFGNMPSELKGFVVGHAVNAWRFQELRPAQQVSRSGDVSRRHIWVTCPRCDGGNYSAQDRFRPLHWRSHACSLEIAILNTFICYHCDSGGRTNKIRRNCRRSVRSYIAPLAVSLTVWGHRLAGQPFVTLNRERKCRECDCVVDRGFQLMASRTWLGSSIESAVMACKATTHMHVCRSGLGREKPGI